MKKLMILFLMLVLVFLVGCGIETEEEKEIDKDKEKETKQEEIQGEEKEKENFVLSERAIEEAKAIMKDYTVVRDIYIEQKENKITLSIIINRATEEPKEFGKDLMRALAVQESIYGEKDLKRPKGDCLGELWEVIKGEVYVGYSADETILHGVKETTRDNIRWFDL